MTPNATAGLAYEFEGGVNASFLQKGFRTSPILFVNGKRVPEKLASQARPSQTLLSFLREVMQLTGSKLGCAEGGCGACTVVVSKKDKSGRIRHISVNACLMPVLIVDGCNVTTVEGVGSVKGDNLHPIQKAMVELHGSQCGFCTPGIIMAIFGLFANDSTVAHLQEHLDGNLCRCTGYRPIWDAARALCTDVEDTFVKGPCGTACRECPERDACDMDCNLNDKEAAEAEKCTEVCRSSSIDKALTYKYIDEAGTDWHSLPDRMFPAELSDPESLPAAALRKPLAVFDNTEYSSGGAWFKPTTMVELLSLLKDFGDKEGGCKIVVGNTEVGIETRFKNAVYPRMISPSDSIDCIFSFTVTPTKIKVGSCTSLSTIQHECGSLAKSTPELRRTALPIHDMLRWFASTQIRNVACLGGNLVTASPISDMNPLLAAMGSTIVVVSLGSDGDEVERRAVAVADFFLRYRVVDLKPTELVEVIEIPITRPFEYVKPFKQARRREDDISIVTSGMRILVSPKDDCWVIDDIAIAFGGMAPKTILVSKTTNFMAGKKLSKSTFEEAGKVLMDELRLPVGVPGGQPQYRLTLAASFLYKFYFAVVEEMATDVTGLADLPPVPAIEELDGSASFSFVSEPKPCVVGVQTYPTPSVSVGLEEQHLPKVTQAVKTAEGDSAVGRSSTHMSGPFHCTGEALYTDDIPLTSQTLHGCLILSKQCGCIFEGLDIEPAMAIPGVVGCFTHTAIEELGGSNVMGPIFHDEILFLPIGQKIMTVGQVLGIAVAETLELAEKAARVVVLSCGSTDDNIVVSIENAIEAGSFFEASRHRLERGNMNVVSSLPDSLPLTGDPKAGDLVAVSGSFRMGGQEHFYLETNCTLAIPSESDTNLTIYCSTQAPTKTQAFCASTTGTPASKVVVRVKRMGGGFGGKETRSVFASAAAAVAAKMTSRPVRLTLPRDVDMSITGGRHAFLAKYKASALIGENGSATLHACDVQLFSNGGWAFDLSGPVSDRALFHVDGCYFYPHFRAEGVVCKTAQPNHTAYRGFGGPQGIAVAEHILEHLAVECKVPFEVMRRENMYKEGQSTHFGMVLSEADSGKWNVPTMFDRIMNSCNFADRRRAIDVFNSNNRWLKRGMALVPTKFGIAFTAKYMNQGGALVHLYTDGTVLVSHGGTEMGQGLHTKVCQIAAHAFGIAVDDVYVNDSSTDKVANTIPTAASMSTDLYGMATLDACRQILGRLEPFTKALGPGATLAQIAKAAFMERVDLSAHGFFALDTTRCGFDWLKGKPDDYPDDKPENSWKGHPFNYFTQGVALAEVEVDTLTGNHRTLRADVLLDVGSSINPMLDIGQIEGAFTQGMGWSTMEEVVYGDDDHAWIRPAGRTFTTGPGTYKIPSFNDVPETFNVSLMENVGNPFAVHSGKAIGEPPFFLGSSIFYAIKDAVRAARKQNTGIDTYFEMRLPATSERIRMYCADRIASAAIKETADTDDASTFQPFSSC